VEELRQAKSVVSELMDELDREGVGYNRDVKMGAMVEVPAAALTADVLAGEADFLSIGTNDLIQFTLAVDRGNETVAPLYNPAHPSVLKLLSMVLEAGAAAGVEVTMCGEMSGDVQFTLLLLGLGLRIFSVAPALVPEVKRVVRSATLAEAEEVARAALALTDSAQTRTYLAEATRRVAPDVP
jgi:phosphotransferase system enzyme I (PtsI)